MSAPVHLLRFRLTSLTAVIGALLVGGALLGDENKTPKQVTKRRQPTILAPDEILAEGVLVPMRSLSFIARYRGGERVITSVRVIKGGDYRSLLSKTKGEDPFRRLSGLDGFGKRGEAEESGFQTGIPRLGGPPGLGNDVRLEIESVPIEALPARPNYAEVVRPTPFIVVAASFPFERQLKEHAAKLGIEPRDVLKEVIVDESTVKDDDGNVKKLQREMLAFEFRWYDVERQVILADGSIHKRKKGDSGWYPLDYQRGHKEITLRTNDTYVDDPEELIPLKRWSQGLMHGLPIAWGDDKDPKGGKHYPKLALKLKAIQQALTQLKEVSDAPLDDRDRFSLDPSNPYGPRARKPVEREPEDKVDEPKSLTVPKHVLLRFLDVPEAEHLREGIQFRYRLRVHLTNPNYGRNGVDPKLSKDKLLVSRWIEMDNGVRLPQKSYLYAVEQRKLDNVQHKKPKDPNVSAAIQLHRWVASYHGNVNNQDVRNVRPVGEWLVADYVAVSLGEYLFRLQPTFVPFKPIDQAGFVLGAQTSGLRRQYQTYLDSQLRAKRIARKEYDRKTALVKKIVLIPFGDASLLADVSGGEFQIDKSIRDEDGKVTRVVPVTHASARELAIVRPDGRLIALDDHLTKNPDADEASRRKRLQAWRERIARLKGEQKVDPPKDVNDPFDPFDRNAPRGAK